MWDENTKESSQKTQALRELKRYQQHGYAVRFFSTALLGSLPILVGIPVLVLSVDLPLWLALAIGCPLVASIGCLSLIRTVPVEEKQNSQVAAIFNAMLNPDAVAKATKKQVELSYQSGEISLDKVNVRLWHKVVVPYTCFLKAYQSHSERLRRNLALDDLKRLRLQREDITELRDQLAQAKEALATKQKEMDEQSVMLRQAEDMVIDRLHQIEVAEAEVAQLKENAEYVEQDSSATRASFNETQIQEKEHLIEQLRSDLLEDKRIVEQQKTELNQLKGELLAQAKSADLSIPSEFEMSNDSNGSDDGDAYIKQIEEELIARLDALSEREAAVEQREINAGMRED